MNVRSNWGGLEPANDPPIGQGQSFLVVTEKTAVTCGLYPLFKGSHKLGGLSRLPFGDFWPETPWQKTCSNSCIMLLRSHNGSTGRKGKGVGSAMKRIFLLSAMLFIILAPVAIAQSKNDPNLRHLRTERRPKSPNVTVAPRHRVYTPGAHKTAKPASVDAQLNKLERQTATLGSGKSARKTTPSPTTTAPKTSEASTGSQPTDFKYRPPKGGLTTTQSGHGPSRLKSGTRGGGNGTGRY